MTEHIYLDEEEVNKIIKKNIELIGTRVVTPQLIMKNKNLRRMNIVASHIEEAHNTGVLGTQWSQLVDQHTKALQDGEIDLEDLI